MKFQGNASVALIICSRMGNQLIHRQAIPVAFKLPRLSLEGAIGSILPQPIDFKQCKVLSTSWPNIKNEDMTWLVSSYSDR